MCIAQPAVKHLGETTIPNFQEFLIIKRNAKLARYFCCCFLRQKHISAAKFDTRFNAVISGCNEGFLLSGDFCKNGHFSPFKRTFGLAGSKLQTSSVDQLTV